MEERERQLSFSPPNLKILIASTPKTGNTWLRHLLAAIYDLPTVNLGFPFDPEAAKAGFFEQFGLSPAATSLLRTIYLSFDSAEARRRWPAIASAPDAFYAWLNQPAEADPCAPNARPSISNLAAHMYRLRPHLRQDFPDPFGRDRIDFAF